LSERARAFIQKVRYSILVFHSISSGDIFNGSLETPHGDSSSIQAFTLLSIRTLANSRAHIGFYRMQLIILSQVSSRNY
jgi:hypothetical protein